MHLLLIRITKKKNDKNWWMRYISLCYLNNMTETFIFRDSNGFCGLCRRIKYEKLQKITFRYFSLPDHVEYLSKKHHLFLCQWACAFRLETTYCSEKYTNRYWEMKKNSFFGIFKFIEKVIRIRCIYKKINKNEKKHRNYLYEPDFDSLSTVD